MEAMEVISHVEEPTEWCAGMVVLPKPKGKVRICVYLTQLNPSVYRERHPYQLSSKPSHKLQELRCFLNWMPILGSGRSL